MQENKNNDKQNVEDPNLDTQEQDIQKNEMGFFKKLKNSIINIEKYPEMAAEGVLSALKHLVKIMLLFAVVISIGLVCQLNITIKNGVEYMKNELPDMTYSEGVLHVDSEEAITILNENSVVDKVIIDTNIEDQAKIDEYVNSLDTEGSGIVVLKDKAIVKTAALASSTTYTYSELLSSVTDQSFDNITKDDVIGYLTGDGMYSVYTMFFVMMFIYTFIIYFMSVLVDTLVLAILGSITSLFTKLKIKFSAVYNMAVYALTLSIILNAIYIVVNMFTGFEIKYFQVMYTSIAYIYLVAAIFMIKSDFVKRQAELTKIMEVQKEVREEIKEQERKEEEEEKKENKDTNKKEKDKDKNDKDDKTKGDEEPTGSEA